MDNREIFIKVYKHLMMNQRMQCRNKLGQIRYRYKGMKCGIGYLIPDDMYHPCFEGKSIVELLIDYIDVRELFNLPLLPPLPWKSNKPPCSYYEDNVKIKLLEALEDLHDNPECTNPEKWESVFYNITRDFRILAAFEYELLKEVCNA